MKQLTGLDASFLDLETPNQFGHVAGLLVFRRPERSTYEPFTAWRTQLEARLGLLPPLRRRLAPVPLGLDRPYWIEDPGFDLDYHVRHAAIPPPGGDEQLCEVVARIVARPLDRTRPLWLSYVIEGLADERFAILTIVHHAAVDGASGVELLTIMLDAEPQPSAPPSADGDFEAERIPGDLELLGRGLVGLARSPARGLRAAGRLTRDLGGAARHPRQALAVARGGDGERDRPGSLPQVRAPRTPFNDTITPHRRLAIRSASLADVKAIKDAHGVTVNDVVMAVCAAGLRTWLESHDALPDKPLVALVPISVRTGDEADRWTNRVSMLAPSLPTDEADPVRRVRRVHETMRSSKELFDALPADRLTDFIEFPPPAVFARAMRLGTRVGTSMRLAPFNLAVSNVPGPRTPLYAAGARLEHYYPVSFILEGQGLNITVHSYLDRLDFGVVSCPELVPDPESILDAIVEEIRLLRSGALTRRRELGRLPSAY